ncbi:MAG: thioredoxin family protein [Gemmataceae bacterium]
MIDLNEANWEPIVQTGRPVLVVFWAPWCGPCRQLSPLIDTLAGHFGRKVTFARLNVDENPEACVRHDVSTIPQLLLFQGKRETNRLVGLQSEPTLTRMLYRALE